MISSPYFTGQQSQYFLFPQINKFKSSLTGTRPRGTVAFGHEQSRGLPLRAGVCCGRQRWGSSWRIVSTEAFWVLECRDTTTHQYQLLRDPRAPEQTFDASTASTGYTWQALSFRLAPHLGTFGGSPAGHMYMREACTAGRDGQRP